MRISNLHKVMAACVVGGMMVGCSSMNSLTIPVTEPAPVFLASSIQSVGIIDRSIPSPENQKMDQLDKILSVEGANLDKEAAHKAVTGLLDELTMSGRFSEVKIIEGEEISNPGMGIFPTTLSWETVARICDEKGVDALFTLSFFDTDTHIDYQAVPVKIAGPLGVSIPAIEHHATTTTIIKTGWRIYDPATRYILDEFAITERVVENGVGINPVNAVKAIVVGRKEDILRVSNLIGQNYASRLLPYYIRVNREYYVKGTDKFEIAKRRAQTGDWDGAAELWNAEVTNSKAKVAGRAYYNMAIINEINGDLETAVDWASKCYSDYNNKEGLYYVRVLKRRIERNAELEAQQSPGN